MSSINKIIILILISKSLFGQELISIKSNEQYSFHQSTDSIELPFFDDFSVNTIDNGKWSFFENISLKDYSNNNAPSLNIVEFDGLNSNGNSYNHPNGYGEADVLISDIINMKNYDNNQTVFMSFYWNFNINGEYPDYQDSIKLEFMNSENNWELVWYKTGGAENFEGNNFIFEIIKITNEFMHENFRFKFSNIGNSEGPFDSWVLDYIYINSNRNENDSTFLDRTLSYSPKKIFKDYFSIPIKHFDEADEITDSLEIKINNLDKNIQPINYSYLVSSDELSISEFIEKDKPLSPILNGFESRVIKNKKINISDYDSDLDSVNLNLKFFITSGDSSLNNINYLNNDTSYYKVDFSNYYSYDDGSGEYAAGLNQKNSELILEYKTLKKDTLTHISILFPNTNNQYNGNINLVAYNSYKEEKILNQPEFISFDNKKFNVYKLNNPVIVEDTFYIGFKQNENNFLPVGLDKNNNTSDKIFFKVDGQWNKNQVIKGSLIIRPIFAKTDYIITEVNEKRIFRDVLIYPNPSNGIIFFSESIDEGLIIDLNGRIIDRFKKSNQLNLTTYPEGIYIILFSKDSIIYKKKIIIK